MIVVIAYCTVQMRKCFIVGSSCVGVSRAWAYVVSLKGMDVVGGQDPNRQDARTMGGTRLGHKRDHMSYRHI